MSIRTKSNFKGTTAVVGLNHSEEEGYFESV